MGQKYDIGKVRAENVAIGDHATAEYGMKRHRASRGCMRGTPEQEGEGMAQRVFLSYRRSDSWHEAIALKVVLEQKLPHVSVFVDTESINPSERWPDRLTAALDHSSAVVALIGPNWRFGADGTDRFADPEDWVLLELAYALEHRVDAFVPVYFDTTVTQAYRDLPRA